MAHLVPISTHTKPAEQSIPDLYFMRFLSVLQLLGSEREKRRRGERERERERASERSSDKHVANQLVP